MADTTDVLLSGLRAEVRLLLTEARQRAKADTAAASDAVRKAADESVRRIERAAESVRGLSSRGSLAWACAVTSLVILLALVLGVWMGSRGVTVSWLMTFGWHP